MKKRDSKKLKSILTRAAAAAIAVLFAALCGCAHKPAVPETTEEPHTTPIPSVPYTVTHLIRYWPEDADYSTCDYACTIEKPEFSKQYYSGFFINAEVEGYLLDIESRIENEYMPASIAKPPYTQVSCSVEYVNGFTNIIFTEEHCYEAQPYTETHVIIVDEEGHRVNLRDVFRVYRAEEIAAGAIARRIAGDSRYYEADDMKVLSAIDVKDGAAATETGCRIYIKAGVLAPFEEGELAFDLSFEDVCPDFVGEGRILTVEEYRNISDFLSIVAGATVIRGENIKNGRVPPYTATRFMAEMVRSFGIASEAGRYEVPKERFEDCFFDCFGAEFPGVDTDAHDIVIKDGAYSVLAGRDIFVCNVDMLEAREENGAIEITGDIMDGSYGSASSMFMAHVAVRLERNEKSPFGFTLKYYGAYK
ncbi:MAG: hypothetical protein J5772_04530 [Clostridia bacterium]|nr:hypothetical protein [Clostridia bacterium]